jgi:heme-degrading monooxygenase HmoA
MEVEAQRPFLKKKKHAVANQMKTGTQAMVVVSHYPSEERPHQWTRSDLGKEQRQRVLRNSSDFAG